MSNRVIIENVFPHLESDDQSLKCVLNESFTVRAVLLCDGHEHLKGDLLYKKSGERAWKRLPLVPQGNDIWSADFVPDSLGAYCYTVEASLDPFAHWKHEVLAKQKAGVLEKVDVDKGLFMLRDWTAELPKADASYLKTKLSALEKSDFASLPAWFEDPRLEKIARAKPDETLVRFHRKLSVMVEPPLAGFGAWYEFFPRSFGEKGEHGTFRTAAAHLDYVADLGFDIVYLPPIHPVGEINRKGKNNSLKAEKGDVGSPWAIGSKAGGHKAVHPALGTMKDFEDFVAKAEKKGLKIALDIAFQCAPDHPYVKEHPEWFRKKPDGTIQFAENPPKKYEDIYPFDFYGAGKDSLWKELKSVFEFWIGKGVTVFRVDNPHTKPLPFWAWLIADLKKKNPEVIFLSEAFTRPHIMKYLAKIGFTQSYTYFTWRTGKEEIQEYLEELSDPDLAAYLRPNFWPNTPDILSGPLRNGSKNDFQIRYLLAATLTPNYGLYGPSFELMENSPRDTVSEEYMSSEKYELRTWDLKSPKSLAPLLKKVNGIRRAHPSFRSLRTLKFHEIPNENLIAYSRQDESEVILTIVNLDPKNLQYGTVDFGKEAHGWDEGESFEVQDLLNDVTYSWKGEAHYIELSPAKTCAHIFRIKKKTAPSGKAKKSHDHHE